METKVLIEWISGQSFYPDKVFVAEYGFCNEDMIAENIATILEKPNLDFDIYYIDCKNESLKLEVIQRTLRKNPKVCFQTKRLVCGGNFGNNIWITSENEIPDSECHRFEKGDKNETRQKFVDVVKQLAEAVECPAPNQLNNKKEENKK